MSTPKNKNSPDSKSRERWKTEAGQNYRATVLQFIATKKVDGEIDFLQIQAEAVFGIIQGKLDLAGIELNREEIAECEVRNAIFDDGSFRESTFSGVKFNNVSFGSCDFRQAVLYDIVIASDCSLESCDFRNARITLLKGLNDNSVTSPFKYCVPKYFGVLAAATRLFRNGSYAEKHTVFKKVETKDLHDSCNKEMKEHINWYQHLMTQIEQVHERSFWNKASLFLSIVFTKYWSSFWVLAFWAISANATVALLISHYPIFFSFAHPNLPSWNWFDAFYYCVVTFTTLGYGDVTPTNTAAQFAAGLVAVAGYFTLGILIYLIARKIDRKF